MKVKAIRAFYLGPDVNEVGSVVDVSDFRGAELIALGKAVRYVEPMQDAESKKPRQQKQTPRTKPKV